MPVFLNADAHLFTLPLSLANICARQSTGSSILSGVVLLSALSLPSRLQTVVLNRYFFGSYASRLADVIGFATHEGDSVV